MSDSYLEVQATASATTRLSASGASYTGILLYKDAEKSFWKIQCPCGVVATYSINDLPLKTTKHPCGKEDHYAVRYE